MRTFIALDFDDRIRGRLSELQSQLRKACPGVKWVDPGQIHLTLKFLGEIDPAQADPIGQELNELSRSAARFDVHVHRVGAFPPAGPARVLWAGLSGGGLAALHRACEERMAMLGFPPEDRPFSPHLTLARNKDGRNSMAIRAALGRAADFDAGRQTIDRVTLYESTLSPKGSIYRAIARYALRGTPPGAEP